MLSPLPTHLVKCAEEDLDAMHPVLLPYLAALLGVRHLVGRLVMDGEQRSDDDVSIDLRQPVDRGVHRPVAVQGGHNQPQM